MVVDLRSLKISLLLRYSKLVGVFLVFVLVVHLWLTVRHLNDEIERLESQNHILLAASVVTTKQENHQKITTENEAEVVNGRAYHTEMDMPRFSMFTTEWLYLVEPGLGKRVVERLFGSRKEDYLQVVAAGNSRLKSSPEISGTVSFMFGIVRLLQQDGMHYELLYKEKRSNGDTFLRKIAFLRPFGLLSLVQSSSDSTFANSFKIYSPTIHFVMTITADHLPKVLSFLENHYAMLGRKATAASLNYDLTIVVFLDETTTSQHIGDAVKSKLDHLAYELSVNIVPMNRATARNFSRGLGLHFGIVDIMRRDNVDSNPLIYTTDVDVVVTPLFLNRCRLHAEKGRRVYFPLVFSMYNPKIIYPLFLNRSVPDSIRERLNIHDETGWWRDFGYGMACFYKTDYDSVGGFGSKLQLRGWGYEDVGLFRKFVQSKLLVVRSVDPGIFHIYHKKQCDAGDIGNARYRSCIASRAYNEASHTQLGVLCLKNGTELV